VSATVGVPWVLRDEDQEVAFCRDWLVHGLTLAEMAALHGFRNINSVTRAAQRLGLPKRKGGRPRGSRSESAAVLTGGRWERCPRRHVLVWVEDVAA
jgi:hypothetical protein